MHPLKNIAALQNIARQTEKNIFFYLFKTNSAYVCLSSKDL